MSPRMSLLLAAGSARRKCAAFRILLPASAHSQRIAEDLEDVRAVQKAAHFFRAETAAKSNDILGDIQRRGRFMGGRLVRLRPLRPGGPCNRWESLRRGPEQ